MEILNISILHWALQEKTVVLVTTLCLFLENYKLKVNQLKTKESDLFAFFP